MDDIKRQRDALQEQLREHYEARDKLTREIEELVRKEEELRRNDERHF